MKRLKFYIVTFCRSAWQLFVFLCAGTVGFLVALFHVLWHWKKYFKASPDNPPRRIIGVYVENTGWRERSGAKGIPLWKRAIQFMLFVAIALLLAYLLIFVKTDP